jgi:hypothetical protein
MTNITINQETIQKIAKDVAAFLSEKGAKKAGYNRCLQGLSQSLFSKSFEEAQKTDLLAHSEQPLILSRYSHCNVVILQYGVDISIITLNGQPVVSSYGGTYSELPSHNIDQIASSLASRHKTAWRRVALPMALSEEDAKDTINIINLAKRMQIFDFKETLFEQLCGNDLRIMINKSACPYTLDGDMDERLQSAIEQI